MSHVSKTKYIFVYLSLLFFIQIFLFLSLSLFPRCFQHHILSTKSPLLDNASVPSINFIRTIPNRRRCIEQQSSIIFSDWEPVQSMIDEKKPWVGFDWSGLYRDWDISERVPPACAGAVLSDKRSSGDRKLLNFTGDILIYLKSAIGFINRLYYDFIFKKGDV